ncbi:MAG: UDP-N-acetylmuramoyl-L-alanine--D-glutamate ligase [Candidimonas sp.]|nr:MAG: UDP-N-acetylmuramoyl-L-alanine--D-glutamate ligase [Candidimonas sp.]TAM22895.1 MAG: UDP-N-acetylmuramoyl-L-alanine--D-glutamate ligase [Candidimonas sp.]TAM76165.1 MAG: UDP-N-acetylmuramoyl-L-alanine--D-glutamate ligase [Candidimonas sp.]
MNTMSFPSIRAGSLILILGLGETGMAAALWCVEHGARLRILDTRKQPGIWDALHAELGDLEVDCRFGPDSLNEEALIDVQSIVISPGLSPINEPVRSFLAMASAHQIEIIGEIELFARALSDMAPQGYQPKVLAITGTNGKTTVTALTRRLCEAGGLSACAAGNISPAALAALRDACASGKLPDVWVLELSSFQLETTRTLAPDAAAVLNVSQDHLDWHGSLAAYAAAKGRLLAMAKVAVVNRDDSLVVGMVPDIKALSVRTFGRDAPILCGDMGLESSHDVRWLAAADAMDFDEPTTRPKRRKIEAEPSRVAGRATRLMPTDALQIRGTHNALNALAALALARVLGLGWATLLPALRDYRGEPHRVEFLRSIAGVDFVEDSKGTNVGATVAALEGLGQKVVLIAGGLGKGQDFSPLIAMVQEHARAVLLIGQDGPAIGQTLADCGVALEQVDTLEAAVERGLELAQAGDAVLLSPACASMDMFRNYGHRAQVFARAVQALALAHGELT